MKWVRSYPNAEEMPKGRSWVVSSHEQHVFMREYDYSALADVDDDILLIEWDMAVGHEDRMRFEEHASDAPDCVLVAPYRLYDGRPQPVWAHRWLDAAGQEQWVQQYTPHCDYFGFGLIYLPRDLVRQFCDAPAPERGRSPFLSSQQGYTDCRFTDQTFSIWHKHTLGRQCWVDWSVRPVHLNY